MDVDRLEQESGAAPSGREGEFETTNAESLATVLTQGLRGNDSRLIDKCLSTSNEGVIKSTVARLQAPDAGTLLETCVSKMQLRVNRGSNLAQWIKAVLLRHTAYLMATPGQQQTLSDLQQSIESRMAMQQPLAMLSGRLDLLLAQTLARKEAAVLDGGPALLSKDADMAGSSSEGEEESSEDESY